MQTQVTITSLRQNLASFINQVAYTGTPISIKKNNKIIAQIVPNQTSTTNLSAHPAFGMWKDKKSTTKTLKEIRQKAWQRS